MSESKVSVKECRGRSFGSFPRLSLSTEEVAGMWEGQHVPCEVPSAVPSEAGGGAGWRIKRPPDSWPSS